MSVDYNAIRAIWEPGAGRPLSDETCREIVANVTGLFELLGRWDEQDRLLGRSPDPCPPGT